MQSPTFIKWPGGKTRLIKQIDPYLPTNIDRYFEPFLGGGAMFFHIKQKYNPKFCVISDINDDLIETFKVVRDNPMAIIRSLHYFSKNDSEKFYYRLRTLFNKREINGIKRYAAFIYFTKSCFNGVYRVNKKGEFNVPYGYYKNRKIFNKADILLASKLLQGVIIKKQDFNKILPHIKNDDLVYLDPCYDPIKRTSFVHYTPKRFSEEDRTALFEFINKLNTLDAKVVLSNNDIKEVKTLYKNDYNINYVNAARCVNVDPRGRGKISELLITNYQIF